jgi:iron complex transport system ATP-binding protein
VGPNGSGKSTLLDLAGGIRHPTSGVLELFGGHQGTVGVREIRARIGFVGHHVAEAIPGHFAVRDVVLTGKRSTLVPWMQKFDADDRRRADHLLARVGCAELTGRPLATCSQGERQRVLLARALFGRPRLLLLDEPAAGLDLPGRELLLEALSSTADASPTTMLVTHHVEEIPRTANPRSARARRPPRRLRSDPRRADRRRHDRVLRSPDIDLVRRWTMARVGPLMPDGVGP